VTEFYDSVAPQLIPARSSACLYYDGLYRASWEQSARFKLVRWITVLGDWHNCGIADYEPGNPVYERPGALRAWAVGRASIGKRARVYCDRDNLPRARQQLTDLDYLVWLATLDGDQLNENYTPGLWAVQFAGGPKSAYDVSVLYGEW
jgi:hypothetical protein